MQIWVDADACPGVIKEILFRAAERVRVSVTLVANQPLKTPPSPFVRAMQVPAGFDVADNRIVELVQAGDLVVTADIPLAAGVIKKGAHALNPRGELYTEDTIGQRLDLRNMMEELRSSGVQTGGPPALNHSALLRGRGCMRRRRRSSKCGSTCACQIGSAATLPGRIAHDTAGQTGVDLLKVYVLPSIGHSKHMHALDWMLAEIGRASCRERV